MSAAGVMGVGDVTGIQRGSQTAVDFVKTFNNELGLSKDAIKEKDAHMASNASHFMTAMPALFYKDVRGPFAAESQLRAAPSPAGLLVGDAHLGNLMTHTGPEGKTVWGWSDCDKAGVGKLEWDLDRLAAHTVISARLADKSFSKDDQKDLVAALSAGYTGQMRQFAESGARPEGFLRRNETDGALASFIKTANDPSQRDLIKKLAPGGSFNPSLKESSPDAAAIRAGVVEYASRLSADAAIAQPVKILSLAIGDPSVGGSNSGLVKYLALVAPRDPNDPPVSLKFKQVLPSAPANGTGTLSQADAARVVENAAVLTGVRNPLVGYATVEGHSCLVEPEQANSAILDPQNLSKKDFLALARAAGEALARSQLQSPSLSREQISSWLGDPSTDDAATRQLHHFAVDYADQTQADAAALKN